MTLEAQADDSRQADALAELREEAARDAQHVTDQAAAPPGQSQPAAPPLPAVADPVAEWRELLGVLAEELIESYPGLKSVYTGERLDRLAARVSAVMLKYGFTAGGFFARFGEEIWLLVALRPLVRDTLKVMKAQQLAPPPPSVLENERPKPPPAAPPTVDALRPTAGAP